MDSAAFAKESTILPTSKNGPEMPVQYTAEDSIELDNANSILYLYGKAVVDYGQMKIKADRIVIYLDSNQVHAFAKKDSTGRIVEKVSFQDGDQTIFAPQIDYDFKSQKGKITEIYTQEGELHLHAEKAKKMPDNNIFVKKGKITTCDHEDPHFYFEASKLKVIPGKVMVAGPTHLVIREFHTPIWVPFGIFPNNSEKQSGIIIPSQSSFQGQTGISDFGYHWAVNDFVHLEFLSSIFFGGSFQLSGNAQYIKKYKYSGNLGLKHNNTISGVKGTTAHSIKKDYSFVWNHTQDSKAHPKSSFTAGISAVTGTYNQTQLLSQSNANSFVQGANTSQMRWDWREKWGTIAVNSRFDQNFTTKQLTLKAPTLTVNMRNQKLYKSLQISGNITAENSITAADSVFAQDWQELMKNGAKATTTIDIGQSFSIPLPGIKYLKFSMPSLTANGYLNSKYISKTVSGDTLLESVVKTLKPSYDFRLGNFGVTTKIYGLFRFKEGMYINAFRHTITPSANLSWTPDFFLDNQDITRTYFDPETGEEIQYSIYENRNYSVHAPTATQSLNLNYGLRNNLQAKIRDSKDTLNTSYKKVNIINDLGVTGSYNFLAEEFQFSDLRLNMNTNPGFLKNLNLSAVISPYYIDTLGKVVDSLMWLDNKIGRLTSASAATRISIKRSQFMKPKPNKNPKDVFDWTMDINYTFSYSNPGFVDASINNSIGLSGGVTLTQNWSINYNLPVNIKAMQLSPISSLNITRKLHCWEMLVTWFPFSSTDNANYTLTIRPKSGILADLKYEKKANQNSLF